MVEKIKKHTRLGLIIIPLLSIIVFLSYSVIKGPKLTHGFASYYTFSRMLLVENDISRAYDTLYFNSKIEEYGINNIHDIANIPTSSFVFLPVAWMPPAVAKIAWTAFSVIFLFISIFLLFKSFDIPYSNIPGYILLTIPFVYYPVYYNIVLGQLYLLILMLFSVSIYGIKKNNAWLVSVPLSIIILIKGYGIIPLIFLAIRKK